MALQASCIKKTFQFNFKARTSRGVMRDKTSWFIRLWDDANPAIVGWGESGPLPGLSTDDVPDFEARLQQILQDVTRAQESFKHVPYATLTAAVPQQYSSIIFGLETALLDLQHGGQRIIFQNDFQRGSSIPINGLIWMGNMDFMMQQIEEKISKGFTCIKLKVGGIDFEKELDIIHYIRKRYYRHDVAIRLDANGAFKPDEVLFKLNELARFTIDSIEQPIKPGLPEMEELCRKSPIPIAFDEELIGVYGEDRQALLGRLKPAHIILKPTLHGGFTGCHAWIETAERLGIGWWITSALESSIGLNAICQFTASYPVSVPQGLGTGAIYENNFPSPLTVKSGTIQYDKTKHWDLSDLA